jgi:hypothetical protein
MFTDFRPLSVRPKRMGKPDLAIRCDPCDVLECGRRRKLDRRIKLFPGDAE